MQRNGVATMKVFRFMSKVEFEKYKNNFILKNNKKAG